MVSESENDIDLSATKGKRSASEMGFDIPPAKRPEPEEDSVTESESDFDMQLPSRPPTSVQPSVLVTGNAVPHCDAGWCSPQLITETLRGSLPEDDSVTESESDEELPADVVGIHSKTRSHKLMV